MTDPEFVSVVYDDGDRGIRRIKFVVKVEEEELFFKFTQGNGHVARIRKGDVRRIETQPEDLP